MHDELLKAISETYKPPAKTFKGEEEERVKWVGDVVTEIIDQNWDNFDTDKDGDLDEEESFKFIESLVPKDTLDREGYHAVFKKYDADGDGALSKAEFQ